MSKALGIAKEQLKGVFRTIPIVQGNRKMI